MMIFRTSRLVGYVSIPWRVSLDSNTFSEIPHDDDIGAEAPMVDVARDQRWGRVAEGGYVTVQVPMFLLVVGLRSYIYGIYFRKYIYIYIRGLYIIYKGIAHKHPLGYQIKLEFNACMVATWDALEHLSLELFQRSVLPFFQG